MITLQTCSRHLLRGAAAGAGALALGSQAGPALAATPSGHAGRRIPEAGIGFGLYSVRTMLAADPEGTLEMLAEAGYAEIEPAYTYGGRTAAQFRRFADANGLRVVGSHHSPDDFRGARAQQTVEGYRAMAQEMNRWGEAARTRGLRWYAHLHDNEFHTGPRTGQTLFDVWLEETGPRLVRYEMDLHWILRTGVDPAPYPFSYEARFPLLHVKDGAPWDNVESDLGEGEIDFPAISEHLRGLSAHHFVIERDQQPDPVRTANVSYGYIRSVRVGPPRSRGERGNRQAQSG